MTCEPKLYQVMPTLFGSSLEYTSLRLTPVVIIECFVPSFESHSNWQLSDSEPTCVELSCAVLRDVESTFDLDFDNFHSVTCL